jgi:hypothetical protein
MAAKFLRVFFLAGQCLCFDAAIALACDVDVQSGALQAVADCVGDNGIAEHGKELQPRPLRDSDLGHL